MARPGTALERRDLAAAHSATEHHSVDVSIAAKRISRFYA